MQQRQQQHERRWWRRQPQDALKDLGGKARAALDNKLKLAEKKTRRVAKTTGHTSTAQHSISQQSSSAGQ
jgi:hypothetical protein